MFKDEIHTQEFIEVVENLDIFLLRGRVKR